MTTTSFDRHVASGRISAAHAAARKAKEQPQPGDIVKPDNSHGYLAGRVGKFRGLIRYCLRLSGLMSRGKNNARNIHVTHNDILIKNLPPEFEGYTLLQLSDLHLDIADDMSEVVGRVIQGLSYDICVITGDFRAQTSGPYAPSVEAFARLKQHIQLPVYAVLGNHDCLDMVDALESLNIDVLLNESRMLTRGNAGLALIGIEDAHYFQCHDFDVALNGVPDDTVKILLSHTPEVYQEAERYKVQVMLSGHTHGGQICLPGGVPVILNADCPRKYCRGNWRYKLLHGYTSTGTGTSVVDVRFNCPPEVVLHRLCVAPA